MDDLQDYIKKWIFRADEDLSVVDRLCESDPSDYSSSICFHAQQAVEKHTMVICIIKPM